MVSYCRYLISIEQKKFSKFFCRNYQKINYPAQVIPAKKDRTNLNNLLEKIALISHLIIIRDNCQNPLRSIFIFCRQQQITQHHYYLVCGLGHINLLHILIYNLFFCCLIKHMDCSKINAQKILKCLPNYSAFNYML